MGLRRYAATAGQKSTFPFPLLDPNATDGSFKSGATFVAGDVQISLDGAAFVNTTNLPTEIGGANGIYSLVLTASEMTCEIGVVTIIDQTATKVWTDQAFEFNTGGNVNALHDAT